MKAVVVVPAKQQVQVIDIDEPGPLQPTEIRLRILEVGVCGTDKEIASFAYGTPPAGSDYLVIGHESLGEVLEVGSAVKGFKKGDLAVTMVRRPCSHPECMACRSGRQDFCYTGDYTERGIKERHGFMTEIVVDDEQYMNHVPQELRDVAVLVEPLTIAEKAITQLLDVQQRLPWSCEVKPGGEPQTCHRVLVLGAGPVGLLGAMAFSIRGFKTYIYSRASDIQAKCALAKSFNAEYIPAETHTVEEAAKLIGQIDVVYEAVGASSLAFEVIKVIGTNSVFIFTGVPGRKAPIQVDTDLIMRDLVLQNQVVFGTVNADKKAFQAAIQDIGSFMTNWPDALRSIITGRYSIDDAAQLLLNPPRNGIKNLVKIS